VCRADAGIFAADDRHTAGAAEAVVPLRRLVLEP
jgi:hypothetical protein